ncbi:MAG: endo alpha-1,4 polygalactosaminidase [Pseudidiomarina maritima]|nr:endo alpha-1,4 polygalactosaminidase [Pseudidiomarina maritima]
MLINSEQVVKPKNLLIQLVLKTYWVLCLSFLLVVLPNLAIAQSTAKPVSSIGFYYGAIDSVRELLAYERVVVNAEAINERQLAQLKQAEVQVYAYLSVGERSEVLAGISSGAKVLGENLAWNAAIMDLTDTRWQQAITTHATKLVEKGFDGLFLDTLDSYQIALDADQIRNLVERNRAWEAQQQALIGIINQLFDIAPQLILNRGFELLAAGQTTKDNQVGGLHQKPLAVVAESLFKGYDAANDLYFNRTPDDTAWLQQQLELVQRLGIETIVIDYVSSQQWPTALQERIELAQQIMAMGHTPYVSNGLLTEFGVSTFYPVARRVLSFFDSEMLLKKQSDCHRFLATLVEYQGYVPECMDIHQLDSFSFDPSRYAAVVYWLSQSSFEQTELQQFVEERLASAAVPSVFIGELPDSDALLQQLGVKRKGDYKGKLTILGAEAKYRLPASEIQPIPRYELATKDVTASVTLVDDYDQQGIGIVKTEWGGIVAAPLEVQEMLGDRLRWTIDPFMHVLPLLQLQTIPVPDITTESGQRILTAHIDGDGFPSKTWTGDGIFAGQSVLDNILKPYKLPHTVSIIEGEIAKHGLYPKDAAELERIALAIFALDNVEIASHTFSHPFFWDDRVSVQEKMYGDSLAIPGYEVDYDREVFGSVSYIRKLLANGNIDKPVRVFLWSGMADPTAEIIKKTEQLGLLNVNGGNTYVVNSNFSIAQVYPHLNWHTDAIQVYAPLMNENLFTELWSENFHGFARAIESFKLLGEPRRYKPVGIYYHMYSGVYPASIKALQDVYDWTLQQPLTPLYLSDYAIRAKSLYETGLARSITDERWRVISTGVRSLRLPAVAAVSDSVYGLAQGPDGYYGSFIPPHAEIWLADSSRMVSGTLPRPMITSANAMISGWRYSPAQQQWAVRGHSYVPLKLSMAAVSGCELLLPDDAQGLLKLTMVNQTAHTWQLVSEQAGEFAFRINCAVDASS